MSFKAGRNGRNTTPPTYGVYRRPRESVAEFDRRYDARLRRRARAQLRLRRVHTRRFSRCVGAIILVACVLAICAVATRIALTPHKPAPGCER